MSDGEAAETPASQAGGVTAMLSVRRGPERVTFDKQELSAILSVYGRQVADGEWRDYSIDFFKDRAVFSIYRRTSEMPLYRIEKNPQLSRRQGAYAVITASGQILKRGHELARVLAPIDRKMKLVAL